MAAVSAGLREIVAVRAAYRCEYCLLPLSVAFHSHEPDHIIPRQHGGLTDATNLAFACFRCNRYKGPNVGSFDPLTQTLFPFFHPRVQVWTQHFAFDGITIRPLTPEGRVTVQILRLNDPERLEEREALRRSGLWGWQTRRGDDAGLPSSILPL